MGKQIICLIFYQLLFVFLHTKCGKLFYKIISCF